MFRIQFKGGIWDGVELEVPTVPLEITLQDTVGGGMERMNKQGDVLVTSPQFREHKYHCGSSPDDNPMIYKTGPAPGSWFEFAR